MITLLTPSKTLDFSADTPEYVTARRPHFADEAARIRGMLATYDAEAIMKLMHVSRPLAERVVAQYAVPVAPKAALWAYRGDVFKGFRAWTLEPGSAAFADTHLLVPSAVYGVLRPYDLIEPYRLEMNARLCVETAKDLHEYWGERLAQYVTRLPEVRGEVCVLSSEEYSKALLAKLPADIVVTTPAFIDRKPDGQEAQVPIYNKMMRGVMGRWIVDHRVDAAVDLVRFSGHGYAYSSERSRPGRPVYYRTKMTPLRFE
jgi:cytoplasmic iron level regulating protein YaaA (DUF328/UPF0246 family)